MGKNTKKKENHKRKLRVVRETRRQFLLTFFDKNNKEKYVEKEMNGFLMVRSFSKQRNLFIVRVYDNENSEEFKTWLKDFCERI